MTVNTNGPKVAKSGLLTDMLCDREVLNMILSEVVDIRESQQRTETLVADFLKSMDSSPMMKTMSRMFGGK